MKTGMISFFSHSEQINKKIKNTIYASNKILNKTE